MHPKPQVESQYREWQLYSPGGGHSSKWKFKIRYLMRLARWSQYSDRDTLASHLELNWHLIWTDLYTFHWKIEETFVPLNYSPPPLPHTHCQIQIRPIWCCNLKVGGGGGGGKAVRSQWWILKGPPDKEKCVKRCFAARLWFFSPLFLDVRSCTRAGHMRFAVLKYSNPCHPDCKAVLCSFFFQFQAYFPKFKTKARLIK